MAEYIDTSTEITVIDICEDGALHTVKTTVAQFLLGHLKCADLINGLPIADVVSKEQYEQDHKYWLDRYIKEHDAHIETIKDYRDVKPVVRCKDCANWARADGKVYGSCSIDALIRNEDFWCANGVENDDGEDVEGWTGLNTMTTTGMK